MKTNVFMVRTGLIMGLICLPGAFLYASSVFIGSPSTKAQIQACSVVGTTSSHIYHLKGSKYIKDMVPKGKQCFESEAKAKTAGFRKAKAQ